MIDVAIFNLEGKEELTLVQCMLKCVSDGYDPSKKFRVTSKNNKYNRADGILLDKSKDVFILCSKYEMENSWSRF